MQGNRIRMTILGICTLGALLTATSPCAGQDREKFRALLQRLPHKSEEAHVLVRSDVSAEVAADLARHGERAWQFFAKRFALPPNRMEFFYVRSESFYAEVAKLEGWTVYPGYPNVGFVWDKDHGKMVLQTPNEPNYGAQLGELCRQALFCSYQNPRDFPWLFEGLALYYQSADRLDASGKLILRHPHPDYHREFRAAERRGDLVSLPRLLTMSAKEFDADTSLKQRAQSLIFVHHLMTDHGEIMQQLCQRLGKDLKNNEEVLSFLKDSLKTDLAGLEKRHLAHVKKLPAQEGSDLAKLDRLDVLKKRFPHAAKDGPAYVYSDLGKEFSQVHAKHLKLCWNYFAKLFGQTPGDKFEIYYTRNEDLFNEIVKLTGSRQLPGVVRKVAASFEGGYCRMYILPYQNPDYETQLHEVSHIFVQKVCPGALPWVVEGSGMYFECALKMDKNGVMRPRPLGYTHTSFVELHRKEKLLPLKKLVELDYTTFYQGEFGNAYNQSTLFFYYLMRAHPKVMTELFAQWNQGRIQNNGAILQYLTSALKMDLPTLEKRYLEYSLKLTP
ncbi:MAG: hypothetical protein L0Y72_00075 [Gemmataceae bacterium]|nr:hypothetical protein [Gemmataceae bacterium]MCI0737406.1 hypothetical protein [Gemmataceae bacterium]